MIDKVLCPYCGSEMVVIISIYMDSPGWVSQTLCPGKGCNALGPRVTGYKTKAAAKAAALSAARARYLPPNRPLTLEEVKAHCKGGASAMPLWVEFDDGISGWVRIAPKSQGCELEYVSDFVDLMWQQYKKSWRCWLKKPTQEEMDAAGWGDAE